MSICTKNVLEADVRPRQLRKWVVVRPSRFAPPPQEAQTAGYDRPGYLAHGQPENEGQYPQGRPEMVRDSEGQEDQRLRP